MGWTLDKALDEIKKAETTKANDAYRHLQAQIIYAKGDYAKAYTEFEALTKTKFNNPELYLEMAQSRQHLGANDQEILDLLNKSIELCDITICFYFCTIFLYTWSAIREDGRI